ncbi:hypothetical protein CCOS2040_22360 [Streptomyces albidoflavus]|nr:hypothetical protein CCOS2040_22360 [Streptomyces albidoflavus]
MFEDEHRLVAAERAEQCLPDAGREVVPLLLLAVAGARFVGADQEAAEEDLGEFGGAGVGQHRALDQLHDGEVERGGGEADGEPSGGR